MKEKTRTTRGIVLASLFGLVALAGCTDDPAGTDVYQLTVGAETATVNLAMGESSYGLCVTCHGAMGELAPGFPPSDPLNNLAVDPTYSVFSGLQGKIHNSMPATNPTLCVDDCADNVAGHIYCTWNTNLAMGCPP